MKPSERVALIYHKDLDGICSAVLLRTGLERLGMKNISTVPGSYEDLPETIQKSKFDKLIVADIGFEPKFMQYLRTPTLIVDHHLIKVDANSDRVVFINPRFADQELYQPAAYIIYKLLTDAIDVHDKEWVAVLGTVADYAFWDCKDLLGKWTDAKTRDDLLDKTRLGKVAFELMGAIFELGIEKVAEAVFASEGLDELMENVEIKNASNRYRKTYEKEMEKFWKNSETDGDIIFSTLKPAYDGFGSIIASEVSRENPDKLIILFKDVDDKYGISARYQSSPVNVGKLMEKTCGGGGHNKSGGGQIDKSDLDNFKKRVKNELGVS